MERLTVNDNKVYKYDTKMEKARALITDSEGNIFVCDMNGSLLLPGGTIDPGEDSLITIKRELKEELGIEEILVEEIGIIDHYHENFPKYKKEGFEKRLNRVYYYYASLDDIGEVPRAFTDYELANNMTIDKYSYDELIAKANTPKSNPWSGFAAIELLEILKVAQEKNIINTNQKTI